ncbi:hypothetical protein ZWY2020_056782 [Hordeum vulgare]|nr:hypothetical protein ZWY2020_056782 [Hordeum vulgare]
MQHADYYYHYSSNPMPPIHFFLLRGRYSTVWLITIVAAIAPTQLTAASSPASRPHPHLPGPARRRSFKTLHHLASVVAAVLPPGLVMPLLDPVSTYSPVTKLLAPTVLT